MGEHFRVFPLSNWTEMDVWQYIFMEDIDIPNLYFTHRRRVINRDGVLLAETRNDRLLKQYDTLIIDEAHERSLNIDFLLGYLKRLIKKRKDLKLIITCNSRSALTNHFYGSNFDSLHDYPHISKRQMTADEGRTMQKQPKFVHRPSSFVAIQ